MNVGDDQPVVARLRNWEAKIAIILGSGLNTIVPKGEKTETIQYSEFQELPKTSVPGHAGQFVFGKIGNVPVIFAQGRVHLYEGHTARIVTAAVRLLADAGVTMLIVTNAAGSASAKFAPGSWMMLSDHINLTGTSPLLGSPQFIDLTEAYSARLRILFREAAASTRITLHEGIYAALLGPQYETPAEVRMLQKLGADAVGMSTVLEVIQARALGLEVAAFSCLTNLAAGLSTTNLSHEEVLITGRDAAASFSQLLSAAFAKL
jgi:purine-nucleoside phosphorylase